VTVPDAPTGAPPPADAPRVRPVRVVVAGVVGLLALALVITPLGWSAVVDAALNTPPAAMGAIALATVVLVLTRVERARILLAPAPSYGLMFPILNASFLLAIATPGRVGALLRPAWLGRHGLQAGSVVMGMVAERLLDLVAITLLLLATVLWAMPEVPLSLQQGLDGARILLGVALVGGLVGLALLPWARWLTDRWLGERPWATGIRRFVETLADGASALLRDPVRSAQAVGWTAVHWGLGLSMGASILWGIDPSLVRPEVVLSFWTGVMLANVLSPTPGGVGAYEAVGTVILASHGVDEATALAGTLVGHSVTLAVQSLFGVAGWVGLGVEPAEGSTGVS